MAIKRLVSESEIELLKQRSKYKGKDFKTLSTKEKDELLELLAKKLNLL